MKHERATTNSSSTLELLEQIRMRPDERRMASASLRQAELLADVLLRAGANLRRAFAFGAHAIGALAHSGKVSPVNSN